MALALKPGLKYYTIIIATLWISSCKSQADISDESKALSNRAAELMWSDPDSALMLLNQATEIDESNYVAHNNKVTIYISIGDFYQAIHSAEQGVKAKPDLAEAVTMLGMLYDYTGRTAKAKEQYSRALEIYNSRLSESDRNRKANSINRAYTLLLLGNKLEGHEAVLKLSEEYPDDFLIQMLNDFDKKQHLNRLFLQ